MSMPPMPPAGGRAPWPVEPRHSNRRPWIIVGVSFAVVVALVVGLLVWQSGSGGDGPAAQSADDGVDHTVGLLTEKDPVCDDWIRYADELGSRTESWSEAEKSGLAAYSTPEERDVFETAAEAMTDAADRFESLVPAAEHVVIQELITQTVVYLRAYAERIPNYVESDSLISGVAFNFMDALAYMCSTVHLAPDIINDTRSSVVDSATALKPFIGDVNSTCARFVEESERQNDGFEGWFRTDSTVPAEEWTPQQEGLFVAVRAALTIDLKTFRKIEAEAGPSILADLIWTHNAYMQAFAESIPTYTPPDSQLWTVVASLGGGIMAACEAKL